MNKKFTKFTINNNINFINIRDKPNNTKVIVIYYIISTTILIVLGNLITLSSMHINYKKLTILYALLAFGIGSGILHGTLILGSITNHILCLMIRQ